MDVVTLRSNRERESRRHCLGGQLSLYLSGSAMDVRTVQLAAARQPQVRTSLAWLAGWYRLLMGLSPPPPPRKHISVGPATGPAPLSTQWQHSNPSGRTHVARPSPGRATSTISEVKPETLSGSDVVPAKGRLRSTEERLPSASSVPVPEPSVTSPSVTRAPRETSTWTP